MSKAQRLADRAEQILRQIQSGQALTTYMHRSHDETMGAEGDVEPYFQESKGEWYGSVFGARRQLHIRAKSNVATQELAQPMPCYYVDCAGAIFMN
jgi:hypothetical protein